MRGWPSSMTRMTEVSPRIAPSLTTGASQLEADGVDADRDRVGDVELVVRDDAGEHEADGT